MVDWIANSIDGKQSKSGTLYLEPEVQRVVGLNGAGLVFLTKRNGSEVLQVFDVLATPPLVRDVMDFGEHEKVLAIRYQATEGVLYWLDGNGGVLRRIPVQTPVPLVLADQDAKISVLVPEAPRRITAARISSWSGGFWPDRGFELADGGYLDLAKDIGQRDWGSWRFRHHGGHLTLVPIEESEMAFPEMECWQIAPGNPGSFGVQVSGLVAGALRINAVARNGEDLEVSYASPGDAIDVALSARPAWFGHWIEVAGKGLEKSRPLFLDRAWVTGVGSGGAVLKPTYIIHHVAYAGQEFMPIELDCRWWPRREAADWRWVIMAEVVEASGNDENRPESPVFGRGAAVQGIVMKRDDPKDLIFGIALPVDSRLGDLVLWQAHGFWEQDGQQEYLDSTLLHTFPVVALPKERIGFRPQLPMLTVDAGKPDPQEVAR